MDILGPFWRRVNLLNWTSTIALDILVPNSYFLPKTVTRDN